MGGEGIETEAVWRGPGAGTASRVIASGDWLAGRFVLDRPLGSGGTGVVWAALDTLVGERVAVKIFDPSVADPASRERLRREVRASRAGHPNLVAIHELHQADGELFLTMELVDGPSLRRLLGEGEPFEVDRVVELGRQIAGALDHLHGQGLVHRDVKPGNILIAPDGTAKLCDLGLARPLVEGVTVTATEMVVGTPAYMAPELGRGGDLVAASDVYALGLTLYQCLSGAVPLSGSTAVETLMVRQRTRPPRLRRARRDCPRWLDRLIGRVLDPDPDGRPTAAEVARALDQRRFAWRPRPAEVVRVVGAAGALVLAIGAWTVIPRSEQSVPDPALDPVANELMVSIENFDSGSVYRVVDGHGRPVHTLASRSPLSRRTREYFHTSNVAFADLDGDGRQDVVFADSDSAVSDQLEIYRRRPDGGVELATSVNLNFQLDYEGESFGKFIPYDVECSDLSGDGFPEVVVAQRSQPYYPAAVRVFDASGGELLRALHPGQVANVEVGDRDRNGRAELYVGATNNFTVEPGEDGSSPVVFVVETDWSRYGQVLDLFGPGRTIAAAVPTGMEVQFLLFPLQRVAPPLTPWPFAVVAEISPNAGEQFLRVHTDRLSWDDRKPLMNMRSFYFDREVSLTSAMWNISALSRIGINVREDDHPDQLRVLYWNGTTWQPDVCRIPQAH